MKACIVLIALCVFCCVSYGQDQPADITLLNGKVLKNARVSKVDPDGLRITHDDGLTKVLMEDLPPDLKEKYHFDPQAATQFRKKEEMDQQQAANAEAQRLQQEQAEKERKAELARQEEERIKNTPRLTTPDSVKGYWLRSLPVPDGITDHQYTAKVKFKERMSGIINSGQLDLEAEKTALLWNQSEFQRVGQSENANALIPQITAVQDAINKREDRKQQAEIAQTQAQLQEANIDSMQQLTNALNNIAVQTMSGGPVNPHWKY